MSSFRKMVATLLGGVLGGVVGLVAVAPPASASTGAVADPVVAVTYTPGIGAVPANQTFVVSEPVVPSHQTGVFDCAAVTGERLALAVTGGSLKLSGSSAAPETPLVGVGSVSGSLALSGRAVLVREGAVVVYTLPVVVRMAVTGTYARVGLDWDLHLTAPAPQVEVDYDPDLTCAGTTVDSHLVAAPLPLLSQAGRLTRYEGPVAHRFSPLP